ncbi:DUF892 family protein [Chryseobacterium sp. TY4]
MKVEGMIKPKKGAAETVDELFEDCLKDALWAENAIIKALPLMVENCTSKELKKLYKSI